jgi:hypothetical protein
MVLTRIERTFIGRIAMPLGTSVLAVAVLDDAPR